MLTRDEMWLLEEKYQIKQGAAAFTEPLDILGDKYPWGASFLTDCARLEAGEPLAYVIGYIPFLNCTIWLDSHPLIPRPETEFWTEQAISTIKDTGLSAPRILDLCAGSGCIGVAVAQALPDSIVHFAELDARHLTTIAKNLETNQIPQNRTHIFQSDLFANVSEQYDYILSNPPYIDPAVDRTEPAVKAYEPHHALYGGDQGLELIEHIILTATSFLRPNGQLWLEHEPEQVVKINQLATQSGFVCTTHNDQFSVPRFSILTVAQ